MATPALVRKIASRYEPGIRRNLSAADLPDIFAAVNENQLIGLIKANNWAAVGRAMAKATESVIQAAALAQAQQTLADDQVSLEELDDLL